MLGDGCMSYRDGTQCVACGYLMVLDNAWKSNGDSEQRYLCHCGTGVVWTFQSFSYGQYRGNRLELDGIIIDSADGVFESADGVAVPHLVGTPCNSAEEHLAIAHRLLRQKAFF